MGRSRDQFGEAGFPHFLTCTVVGWLPVFTRPETARIEFKYIHNNAVGWGYVSDPTHWRVHQAQELCEDRVVNYRHNRLVIHGSETTRSVEDGIPTRSVGTSHIKSRGAGDD